MKVLYIIKYPLNENYSIKAKVDGQVSAIKNLGNDVYYTAYDDDNIYLIHDGFETKIKKIKFKNFIGYNHIISYINLFNFVRKLEINFDVIYMRDCPYFFSTYRALKKLHKKSRIVIEIPTYPSHEKAQSLFRKIYSLVSRLYKRICNKYVSLYTLIGEKSDSYNNVPAINIENGICLDNIKLRDNKFNENKINLLCLASMSYWQGYDRLLNGLYNLNDFERERYHLYFVGSDGDGSLKEWKKLAMKLGIDNYVDFCGYKSGFELDEVFNKCDLGVAPLGTHRKKISTTSTLKVREYMARGLPFIYVDSDPFLKGNENFCHRVPGNDSPINFDEISIFYEKIKKIPNISVSMRNVSKEKMTWEKQFIKVFTKLKEV